MSHYFLAPAGRRGLAAIREYQIEVGGIRVTRRLIVDFVNAFRLLAKNPGLGHRREDLAEDRQFGGPYCKKFSARG
jgi:plasmid stabilization system protein ParE